MTLHFEKYHGTGNDFVMIDGVNQHVDHTPELAKKLCNRHFGIGSDGLVIVRSHADFDFEMVFYNPDGSQSFCGNGSRCAVRFAAELGLVVDRCQFLAIDGVHLAEIHDEVVRVQMKDVSETMQIEADMVIHTGSPHYVRFVEEVQQVDIVEVGRAIRYSDRYREKGVNVNVVSKINHSIAIRTYERGVEDETLSCGTGVTAAALASAMRFGLHSPVDVATRGGDLKVFFQPADHGFTDIWLCGPAQRVFSGTVSL